MRFLTPILILSLFLFAACGGENDSSGSMAPADVESTPANTDATAPVDDSDTMTDTEDMTGSAELTDTTPPTDTDALIETMPVTDTAAMTATGIITAPMAQTTLYDTANNPVGDASFTETEDGVIVQVTLREFTAAAEGEHGVHIHTVGACTPDFQAAGGHFNPTGAMHGLENSDGPHAGDLPNIEVDGDGNAIYEATATMVTLGDGEGSLFDEDGSALVIHAGPDDMVTDPSGDSGDRIACGVIDRQ